MCRTEERKKNNNKKRSKHNMSRLGDIIMVNLEKLEIFMGTII